jgi:hypothetical protein
LAISGEGVGEGFDNSFSTEVAAADADSDYYFAVVAQLFGSSFDVGDFVGRGSRGEVDPTEEVVAGAGCVVELVGASAAAAS